MKAMQRSSSHPVKSASRSHAHRVSRLEYSPGDIGEDIRIIVLEVDSHHTEVGNIRRGYLGARPILVESAAGVP